MLWTKIQVLFSVFLHFVIMRFLYYNEHNEGFRTPWLFRLTKYVLTIWHDWQLCDLYSCVWSGNTSRWNSLVKFECLLHKEMQNHCICVYCVLASVWSCDTVFSVCFYSDEMRWESALKTWFVIMAFSCSSLVWSHVFSSCECNWKLS